LKDEGDLIMKSGKRIPLIIAVLTIAIVTTAMAIPPLVEQPVHANTTVLKFDVAEDATRFVFDDAPVLDNGLPAYGNAFVTSGYLYEYGTLNGSNGVQPDGSPQFPDKVVGYWICRGWFIGEGAHTQSGAMVVTTQYFQIGDGPGGETIITDGVEIADLNQIVYRAITGGTGPYSNARGQGSQELLAFNQTEGVNLRVELAVKTRP
jgi:hypothetical protein